MYDRILVPTDGSDGALAAAEHAVSLAREQGATVHALSVVHLRPSLEPNVEAVLDALEARAEAAVETVEGLGADAGVEVVSAIEDAVPSEAIVDYAADHDVGLVVMGSHGHSRLHDLLLGSTTERVLRTCDRPVLVVRA